MKTEYEVNQRVIWDSGYGYEIALFKGVSNSYNNYDIEYKSGAYCGKVGSVAIQEVHPYSVELAEYIAHKYGYEKKFSETF